MKQVVSIVQGRDTVCVFILSTYTDGTPPEAAAWFCQWLEETSTDFRVEKTLLQNLQYCVFGLGNSLYTDHYNTVCDHYNTVCDHYNTVCDHYNTVCVHYNTVCVHYNTVCVHYNTVCVHYNTVCVHYNTVCGCTCATLLLHVCQRSPILVSHILVIRCTFKQ